MSEPLTQAWLRLVSEQPSALAVREKERCWTRRELDNLANQIQGQLAALPLRRHGVIMQESNSAQWLATWIALRRLGAVIASVDTTMQADKVRDMAARMKCFALQSQSLTTQPDQPRQWKKGLAFVKLTSGTSGDPKAIPFTEAELHADGENIMQTMGFGPGDLNFALLPFAHSYALGNLVAPLLCRGVPMTIGSEPLPRIIAEEIKSSKATVFPSVPSVFEALSRTDDISLGNLRLCISAAAALKPELARGYHDRFGLALHNFYGASECGGIAYDQTGQLGITGESVGLPMHGVELTQAVDGRLRVASRAVSSYRRSVDTHGRASITLDDKVTFNNDGSVVILGRTDRTVKCGGRRINLAELETAATRVADVNRAAAIHHAAQDRIYLFVQGNPCADQIAACLPLASQRIRIQPLAQIPISPRGKVDYRKLANQVK